MTEFKPGWTKTKRDSILNPGTTEVAFLFAKENDTPWSVVADHCGVHIRGESPLLRTNEQLQIFAQVLGASMEEYLKLRKARIVVQH